MAWATGYRRERRRVENEVGYYPDIDSPSTINEKILWKKINVRDPMITKTSDKVKAREYVREKLVNEAEGVIIPILDTAKDPSHLSLSEYEVPYVIKANHGCLMNLFIHERTPEGQFVVSMENTSKTKWSVSDIESECLDWLNTTLGFEEHQWGYLNIERKLFVEPFISDSYGSRLTEAKIDCFHGEPKFIHVIVNRTDTRLHTLADVEGRRLEVRYGGREGVPENVLADLRSSLPRLREWSSQLSEEFEYCRVDFYLKPDGPYFSEITHYPASGRRRIKPREFELEMGRQWKLKGQETGVVKNQIPSKSTAVGIEGV